MIQTAFIGDAILATGLLEKLHHFYPNTKLDLLVRQGNEALFKDHPFLNKVLVWNKKENKLKNLFSMLGHIREERYDIVVNLQRFASSGLLTAFSNAGQTIGFDKNPLSLFFSKKIKHDIGTGRHEVERNNDLIASLTDASVPKPRLYPTEADYVKTAPYKPAPYICIAPNSVWFTKQYPEHKWVSFIQTVPDSIKVYLMGGPGDKDACERIKTLAGKTNVVNTAGLFSFLASAALMKDALMNYVNDSGPLHIASSMNAPTTAVFCSTILEFGFGPLADNSVVLETPTPLSCRPCGLHGRKACPEGHFKCAENIDIKRLFDRIS